jgi:hypothetical protein
MGNDEIDGAQGQLAKVVAFVVELGAGRCSLEQLKHWRDQLHGAPPAFDVIAG